MAESKIITLSEVGDVLLERSYRAKHIIISVKSPSKIRVAVPVCIDFEKAHKFAEQKEYWIENQLAKCAQIRGAQLMGHFENIQSEFPDKIKEVRGKGLLTAFEMHNYPQLDGHQISLELLKKGVYVKETHKNTVRIAPALTIESWQIDNISEAIRDVIKGI